VRTLVAGVADAPSGSAALIEPEALAVARVADATAVAGLMRRFQHALDPDASDEAALARYERRGLTLSPLPDGMVSISGLADEVTGSMLMTAIDAASPLVSGDRRTAAQRRLDAAAELARRFLASPDSPRVGGGHAQVIVTVDHETLSAETGPAGSPGATLSWVGPIAGSTARRLACDADVSTVFIDKHGRVTAERHDRRYFTVAQHRAMIARDGDRCAVPYCDRPVAWADGHHLVTWQSGGPTTTDNGALPCAAHHTLLHEGGWTLERLVDGRYLMRHRDGKVIGPEAHPPGHNRPAPRGRRQPGRGDRARPPPRMSHRQRDTETFQGPSER
jgi:hypothetical protein